MRKYLYTWCYIGVLLLCVSCSKKTFDVKLTSEISPNAPYTITVTTNLPDETMLSLEGMESDENLASPLMLTDDEQTVKQGKAIFQLKTLNEDAIRPGTYDVTISSGVMALQPKSLHALFGAHGEQLRGNVVREFQMQGKTEKDIMATYILTIKKSGSPYFQQIQVQ